MNFSEVKYLLVWVNYLLGHTIRAPLIFAWCLYMRILINCLNSETFISYFILRDPLLVILVCGIWFMILSQIYCRPNQNHVRHSIILVVFNMIFCPGLVSYRLFFAFQWEMESIFISQCLEMLAKCFFLTTKYMISLSKVIFPMAQVLTSLKLWYTSDY